MVKVLVKGNLYYKMPRKAVLQLRLLKIRMVRAVVRFTVIYRRPGNKKWWTWPGSNRRPRRCERRALPAELHAQKQQQEY